MQSPTTIDRASLMTLKRSILQQLAKRENIKANGKNMDIVTLLLDKYPGGVPRLQRNQPILRKESQASATPMKAEVMEELAPRQSKRRRVDNGISNILTPERSVNLSSLPLSLQLYHHEARNYETGRGKRRYISPPGPGNKCIRFVKREVTQFVNDGIAGREEVNEMEVVLSHVMSIVNEVSRDVREISWMRYCAELDFVTGLKKDRTLWDGTRMMPDEDRDKWESFLEGLKEDEVRKGEVDEGRDSAP